MYRAIYRTGSVGGSRGRADRNPSQAFSGARDRELRRGPLPAFVAIWDQAFQPQHYSDAWWELRRAIDELTWTSWFRCTGLRPDSLSAELELRLSQQIWSWYRDAVFGDRSSPLCPLHEAFVHQVSDAELPHFTMWLLIGCYVADGMNQTEALSTYLEWVREQPQGQLIGTHLLTPDLRVFSQ